MELLDLSCLVRAGVLGHMQQKRIAKDCANWSFRKPPAS